MESPRDGTGKLSVAIAFCGVFGVLGLFVGMAIGSSLATQQERAQAIEARVGRFVVDASTGATTFVYGKEK